MFEYTLPMFRECTVFYTAISQDEIPAEYDFKRINTITSRKIKTDLLPVIKKREFLTRFKSKHYSPELLFDDRAILERISRHPRAIWKMRET